MKNYFSLLLIFLLGCQTTPSNPELPNKIPISGQIEIDDIYAAVNVYPMNGAVICDTVYDVPTKNWIQNVFVPALNVRINNRNYILQGFDCDNFSSQAYVLASDLSYGNKSQLAIGEIHYIKDSGIGHAINFIIVKGNRDYEILFLEPQNGQIIKLSEKEILSCSHWKI